LEEDSDETKFMQLIVALFIKYVNVTVMIDKKGGTNIPLSP
jgi:hypothetical protein